MMSQEYYEYNQERIEPAKTAREHATTIDGEIQICPDANFSNYQIWTAFRTSSFRSTSHLARANAIINANIQLHFYPLCAFSP